MTKCTVERFGLVITLEVGDVDLEFILESFEDALKGCGFSLPGPIVIEEEKD